MSLSTHAAPEFSRLERTEMIGEHPRVVVITADAGERAALARRFGLVSIEALGARVDLRRDGRGVIASGTVSARLVQACVVTDDPVAVSIDEPVVLRFAVIDAAAGDEIELSEDALDTLPITDDAIDLGEAAAETMALALDPFPRGPRAATELRAAGVLQEGEARPFGALSGLRDKLAGKG